jgi:hypothetical protein
MNTDWDLELGAALRDLPTPEHGPGFWDGLDESLALGTAPVALSGRPPRRFAPRGVWLLSVAAAVAVVVAAVAVVRPHEGTRLRVTPAVRPEAPRWTTVPAGPLAPRREQVSVWTGTRMLLWGGTGDGDRALADGAAYDPATGRWTPMAPAPTPALAGATAVWTGGRMLVWGSVAGVIPPAPQTETGAAYDPATDRWTPISPAPLRTEGGHTAVWTGSRMLVWGGNLGESPSGEGASYDPATNRWTRLAPAPIAPRFGHTAVWTGDRMIVWGGFPGASRGQEPTYADGASYDPATDSWAPLAAAPVTGRAEHTAVWTGRSMVVWGGTGDAGLVADGASYDPATGAWRALPPSPLAPRVMHTAVAGGATMLVWGGDGTSGALADGAAYDPVGDTWRPMPDAGLQPRSMHTAVWTGSAMIVWGGADVQARRTDAAALRPGRR